MLKRYNNLKSFFFFNSIIFKLYVIHNLNFLQIQKNIEYLFKVKFRIWKKYINGKKIYFKWDSKENLFVIWYLEFSNY